MLKLPETSQTYATIIGIDPGSESLGVAEINFDIQTLEVVGWQAVTYLGSKLLKGSAWTEEVHGARYRRLIAHRKNLIKLFEQIRPFLIACEAPFINMRRPQAYGALTEVVYEIRQAVIAYSPWNELYLIDPSSVKNGVGAKGNADKDAVKVKILQIEELQKVATSSMAALDEHSIDALAVAYVMLNNLKLNAKNRNPHVEIHR